MKWIVYNILQYVCRKHNNIINVYMVGKVLLLKAFWEFTELKTQAVQNKYDHRTN